MRTYKHSILLQSTTILIFLCSQLTNATDTLSTNSPSPFRPPSPLWNDFRLAAFADLNNDRFVDVLLLQSPGFTNVYSVLHQGRRGSWKEDDTISDADYDARKRMGQPELLLKTELNEPIWDLSVVDFNGDSIDDLLLVTKSTNAGQPFTAYVAYGKIKDHSTVFNAPVKIGKFSAQPIVVDFNNAMFADLYGQEDADHRVLYSGGPKPSNETRILNSGPTWSSLGFSAFGDLNGDLIPDLLILVNDGSKYKLQQINRKLNGGQEEVLSIDLPADVMASKDSVMSSFSLNDFDSDGSIDLLIIGCTTSDCKPETTHAYLYDFESKKWSSIDVNWTPPNAIQQPDNKCSIASLSDPAASGPLIGPSSADVDLDGRVDLAVGLRCQSSNGGVFWRPAILANRGRDSTTGKLQFELSHVPPISTDRRLQQIAFYQSRDESQVKDKPHALSSRWDILFTSINENTKELDMQLIVQKLPNEGYFLKVAILNGRCESKGDCTNSLGLPYGLPHPGLTTSYNSEAIDGGRQQQTAIISARTCCGSLQLPYTVFGLGPFANYVEKLFVAIPPGPKQIRQTMIPFLVPNSQVVINPYPLDKPTKWKAKLFIQPLYNMRVLYIGIVLICICIVLAIAIIVLHCLEVREDRLDRQREAQRFHYDAL